MNRSLKVFSYILVFFLGVIICYIYNLFHTEVIKSEAFIPGDVKIVHRRDFKVESEETLKDCTSTNAGITSIKLVKVLKKLGYECSTTNLDSRLLLAQKGSITIKFADGKAYVNGKEVKKIMNISSSDLRTFEEWDTLLFAFYDVIKTAEPNITMSQRFYDVTIYVE